MTRSGPVSGVALLVLLTLVWGVSWPISKVALTEIDPWTFRATTLLGSGITLLILTRLSGGRMLPARSDLLPLLLVSIFNISAWHLLSAFGLRESDAAHAVIVAYSMPIWATLLGMWLLSESVEPRSLLALALVIGGLLVLVGGNLDTLADSPGGLAMLLLAALSWAYGTIRQKQLRTELGLTAIAGWQLLIGVIPIVAGMVSLGQPERLADVSHSALGALGFLLVAMVFCYHTWFKVVRIFPAHIASIGTATVPVLGVVASGIILNENLGPEEFGALALEVAGLLVLTVRKWPSAEDLRSTMAGAKATSSGAAANEQPRPK